MRRLTALLFAGAMLAPLSLAAQVGPPRRPDVPPRMHMGPLGMGPAEGVFAPRMLLERRARLELTEEQVKQLEALSEEVKQAHDKAAADAKPHEDKLAELWQADQPDAAALQAEMRALMQVRQTAALVATAAAAKAKGLLTAEQRGRVEGWADARRMHGARMRMHPRMHRL